MVKGQRGWDMSKMSMAVMGQEAVGKNGVEWEARRWGEGAEMRHRIERQRGNVA